MLDQKLNLLGKNSVRVDWQSSSTNYPIHKCSCAGYQNFHSDQTRLEALVTKYWTKRNKNIFEIWKFVNWVTASVRALEVQSGRNAAQRKLTPSEPARVTCVSREGYCSLYIKIGDTYPFSLSLSLFLSFAMITITRKKEINRGIKQPTNSFMSCFRDYITPGFSLSCRWGNVTLVYMIKAINWLAVYVLKAETWS